MEHKRVKSPVLTSDTPTYLVVNPHSRTGSDAYPTLVRRLSKTLNLVGHFLPDSREELRDVISAGLERGVIRFCVGGGDGTLSLAANTLAHTSGVLATVPLGTGNTFALNLGLELGAHAVESLRFDGPVEAFDLGEVQTATGQRLFLNGALLGITEQLVRLLTPEAKRTLGWGAWPIHVHQALKASAPFQVHLEYLGHHLSYRTRQLVVAKGRHLAGPIFSTPEAHHQDGQLHVFSLGTHDWWSLVRVSSLLLAGRHINDRAAHYCVAPEMHISTEPPLAIDLDGDLYSNTPTVFRVQREALWVLRGMSLKNGSVAPNAPGRRSPEESRYF